MKNRLAVLLLLFCAGTSLHASCPPLNSHTLGFLIGSTVTYDISSFGASGSVERASIKRAFDTWNTTATCLGITFSETDNSSSDIAVVPGSAGGAPSTINFINDATGVMTNAIIVIDINNVGAPAGTKFFDSTQSTYGSAITKIGLHELGHVMGLGDTSFTTGATCGGQTAGQTVMNGECGTNDSANNIAGSPTTCDVSTISKNPQCLSASGGGDGTNCLGGTGPITHFSSGGGGGGTGPAPDCSPILLDVYGEGFHLTSASNGVMFDIQGTGTPVQLAWTDPAYSNAFLALDRNGNGVIDNGTELFGNFTPQPASPHPNGFLALAEFDKPENGGNGNGVIDGGDAVFPKLRLWIDADHDGICQPNELHTLAEFGITSISLNYKVSWRTDAFGNVFEYHAKVNPSGASDTSTVGPQAYDIFLSTQ